MVVVNIVGKSHISRKYIREHKKILYKHDLPIKCNIVLFNGRTMKKNERIAHKKVADITKVVILIFIIFYFILNYLCPNEIFGLKIGLNLKIFIPTLFIIIFILFYTSKKLNLFKNKKPIRDSFFYSGFAFYCQTIISVVFSGIAGFFAVDIHNILMTASYLGFWFGTFFMVFGMYITRRYGL